MNALEFIRAVSDNQLDVVATALAADAQLAFAHSSIGPCPSALWVAARAGHRQMLRLLLPMGDKRALNSDGETPLMGAVLGGSVECVRLLLPGSDPHAVNDDAHTALMLAAIAGRTSCVEVLLPVSKANLVDDEGRSALMLAAWNGHEGCVQALLPASRLAHVDERGQTALMMASRLDAAGICQLLLDAGADPAVRCNAQRTALHWAAHTQAHDCIDRLLPVSDPHARDRNGLTPLLIAACDQDERSLERLAPHSDMLACDPEQHTALALACKSFTPYENPQGAQQMADLFAAIDPFLCNTHGDTPLLLAAASGHLHWVEHLLDRNPALALVQNNSGMTPLQCATLAHYLPGVLRLLPHSELHHTNQSGSTALDLAVGQSQHEDFPDFPVSPVLDALLSAAPSAYDTDPTVLGWMQQGHLPQSLARIERQDLQQALNEDTPTTLSGTGTPEGPLSPPTLAPARRHRL